jgi:hypothetical protein
VDTLVKWWRKYVAVGLVVGCHYLVSLLYLCSYSPMDYIAFCVDAPSDHLGYALFLVVLQFPLVLVGAGGPAMVSSASMFAAFSFCNAVIWGVAIVCLWHAALKLAPVGVAILPRLRPPPGHCRTCGYDLRATPGRCPECGTRVPPPRAWG